MAVSRKRRVDAVMLRVDASSLYLKIQEARIHPYRLIPSSEVQNLLLF